MILTEIRRLSTMILWIVSAVLLFSRNIACASQHQHVRSRHLLSPSDEVDEPPLEMQRILVECTAPVSPDGENTDLIRTQQDLVISAIEEYMDGQPVTVVARQEKLWNALFLLIPADDEHLEDFIENLHHVQSVSPSLDLEADQLLVWEGDDDGMQEFQQVYQVADQYLGGQRMRQNHCLTGKGVRVAVIDSGIDYTHVSFGGSGNPLDYLRAASSRSPEDDGLFPTNRVVGGRDFVSPTNSPMLSNPIDIVSGHGTQVASTIASFAPEAELLALKVCTASGSCPDYAVVAALAYAYEQGADIVNISLGQPYSNGFYNYLARIVEDATKLGMVITLPSGNYGNKPFIMGGIADVPNAITVGATSTSSFGKVGSFSARGPGILNNLKPDISAPGSTMVFANGGSGNGGITGRGTSFAAPLVSSAAALIIQKCPECSNFAVKSILMNNAKRSITHNDYPGENAPISWIGSGEIDVEKAINAPFWAYSVEDTQPSIQLGLVDVVEDIVIKRQIRLTNLLNARQELNVQVVFRDPAKAKTMEVSIKTSEFRLQSPCQRSQVIDIEFRIKAHLVPSNHMTSGGVASMDHINLDRHEFDGWIVITSTDHVSDIGIPFYAILRKAAKISLGVSKLPSHGLLPPVVQLNMENEGAGIAQIDAYEWIATSHDDFEPVQNVVGLAPPVDFRNIGYRTIATEECTFVMEFAFQLWERRQTLSNIELKVFLDVDGDEHHEFILTNHGPRETDSKAPECRIQESATGRWSCANFSPDHSTNSATIILRACSDDLGIKANSRVGVRFSSAAYPRLSTEVDTSEYTTVNVPSIVQAKSINLHPGATFEELSVLPGGSGSIYHPYALGILFVTNSFRDDQNTGASVSSSEGIGLPFIDVYVPAERTPDILSHTPPNGLRGPSCSLSSPAECDAALRHLGDRAFGTVIDLYSPASSLHANRTLAAQNCEELRISSSYLTIALPTSPPSISPSMGPSSFENSRNTFDSITGGQQENTRSSAALAQFPLLLVLCILVVSTSGVFLI